jgi:hypothetical protein
MTYFDANQVPDSEPGDDYGTIPVGVYDGQIEKAEEKTTNAGNGTCCPARRSTGTLSTSPSSSAGPSPGWSASRWRHTPTGGGVSRCSRTR